MTEFVFDRELVRSRMEETGVKRAQLAAGAGLTHASAVSKIFSGERAVKVDEAQRIYEFLGLKQIEGTSTRSIPIIGLAAAGNWREAVTMPLGHMVIPTAIIGDRGFAIEVKGDSMNMLIDDGGWVAIDPQDQVLKAGKCYLIENDEFGVTVKRYQTKPARFEPVSSNPEHKPFEVTEVRYHILGRVVWKGEPL